MDDTNEIVSSNATGEQGRWTSEEHELFLQGIAIFGKNWKQVQQFIKTRTAAQIRSHAQKYFQKIARTNNDRFMHDSQSSIGEDAFNVLEYLDHIQNTLETATFITSTLNDGNPNNSLHNDHMAIRRSNSVNLKNDNVSPVNSSKATNINMKNDNTTFKHVYQLKHLNNRKPRSDSKDTDVSGNLSSSSNSTSSSIIDCFGSSNLLKMGEKDYSNICDSICQNNETNVAIPNVFNQHCNSNLKEYNCIPTSMRCENYDSQCNKQNHAYFETEIDNTDFEMRSYLTSSSVSTTNTRTGHNGTEMEAKKDEKLRGNENIPSFDHYSKVQPFSGNISSSFSQAVSPHENFDQSEYSTNMKPITPDMNTRVSLTITEFDNVKSCITVSDQMHQPQQQIVLSNDNVHDNTCIRDNGDVICCKRKFDSDLDDFDAHKKS